MTVSELLDAWASERPGDVAFVAPADKALWTAADLAQRAQAAAALLAAKGIGRGDVLACMLRSGAAYAEAVLGGLSLGAALAPVDTMLKGPDARDVIAAAGAVAVLTDEARAVELEGMLDSRVRARWIAAEEEQAGYERWHPGERATPAATAAGDIALLLARFDYPNVNIERRSMDELAALARSFEISGDDRVVCSAPLGAERSIGLLVAALAARARFVCPTRFDPPSFWELVAAHQATFALLAPSQALDLSYAVPDTTTLRRIQLAGKASFSLATLAPFLPTA